MITYTTLTLDNASQYRASYIATIDTFVPSQDIAQEDFLTSLQAMIAQGTQVVLAIDTDKNVVVGAATLLIEHKLTKGGCKAGHLEEIAIHPDYQSQGIGKVLVQEIIDRAKKAGCYKIIADTSEKLLPRFATFGFETKEHCIKLYLSETNCQ